MRCEPNVGQKMDLFEAEIEFFLLTFLMIKFQAPITDKENTFSFIIW